MKNEARTAEFIYVVVPKVFGGVAAFILNVLLMKLFRPSDFGKFSLCLYYVLLFDGIIGSAVDYGTMKLVPRFTREERCGCNSLEGAAFRLKFVLSAIVVIVSTALGGIFGSALFHDDRSAWLIPLSSLAGAGIIMLRSLQVHFQIQQRFKAYGLFDLGHSFLRYSLVGAALAFLDPSPQTIILFFAIAPLLLLTVFWMPYLRNLARKSKELFAARKELVGVVKWYLCTFCLGAVIGRCDVYLVSFGRGLNEAGIFSAASVYAMVPELVASYLAVVFQPKIIRNAEAGTLGSFLRTSTKQNLAAAIPTTAATVLTAIFFMNRFVSDSYGAGKMLLLILAPGALASMMTLPLTMPMLMFLKPSFWIRMEVIALPFLLATYWIAIARHGAYGAAVVTSIYKSAKCLVSHYAARRYVRLLADAAAPVPFAATGG